MNRMKTIRITKYLVWIPAIIMFILIFVFSSQNGEESGGLSTTTATMFVDFAETVHIITPTSEEKTLYIENIEYPVRKCAHMTEYAILGIFVFIALYYDGVAKHKSGYLAFCIAVAYACSDEIHQLSVPDRAGRPTDVLFDSTGCLIGILLCLFVLRILQRKKKSS